MKQISIIHQSAENHQGQKILNVPRMSLELPFEPDPRPLEVRTLPILLFAPLSLVHFNIRMSLHSFRSGSFRVDVEDTFCPCVFRSHISFSSEEIVLIFFTKFCYLFVHFVVPSFIKVNYFILLVCFFFQSRITQTF